MLVLLSAAAVRRSFCPASTPLAAVIIHQSIMLRHRNTPRRAIARPPALYPARQRREGGHAMCLRCAWEVSHLHPIRDRATLCGVPAFVVEDVGSSSPIGLERWLYPGTIRPRGYRLQRTHLLLRAWVNRGPIEGPPDGEPHQHAGAEHADVGPHDEEGRYSHYEAGERPSGRPPLVAGGHGDAPCLISTRLNTPPPISARAT
jgi:hypothetical protein